MSNEKLSQEDRKARLSDMLNELLSLQMDSIAARLQGPSGSSLADRLDRLIDEKCQQIREFAFGGEQR